MSFLLNKRKKKVEVFKTVKLIKTRNKKTRLENPDFEFVKRKKEMGCAQSKVENEESVARCKERKILMKEAVVARNAFAAGHSGYSTSLKNIGAALSDYAHGEVPPNFHFHQTPLEPVSQPPLPSMENLPSPPPLPNLSPSLVKRALSMPEMPLKQHWKAGEEIVSVAISERDEEEEYELDHGAPNKYKNHNGKDLRDPQDGKVGPAEEGATTPRTPENQAVPLMPEAKNMASDYFFMVDSMSGPSLEPDEVDNDQNDTAFDGVEDQNDTTFRFGDIGNPCGVAGVEIDGVEPKTPEKAREHLAAAAAAGAMEEEEEEEEEEGKKKKHIEHSKMAPSDYRVVRGIKVVPVLNVNLMQVLSQIDDHFLKASESALDVSKMLEANRLHYHSNFADNRGINIR